MADWNGNNNMLMRPFVTTSRPADLNNSFSFLFNYDHNLYPGMEMKYPSTSSMETQQQMMMVPGMDNNQLLDKKKRLTSEQLDSLETSFQEDIKLDPDRKMKMARELGLQPRQIAVWFQNRRARWKNKQLERLYDMLKQDFDLVSREKQKLQEEVIKLKTILREQAALMSRNKPISTGYTDQVSGEDTVESTSVAIHNSDKPTASTALAHHPFAECNYVFNVNDYNPISSSSPYWGTHVLPSYP